MHIWSNSYHCKETNSRQVHILSETVFHFMLKKDRNLI